ncbi:hypothetical protein [Neobacillus sp. D3-1R]|uniref:hypothetical protein n=1 Tax=Neobacillus sp. D3-1R TaxID=3445778 RepID=UPI003FA1535F
MKGIATILLCILCILFIKMKPISDYDQYRSWFDKEIAFEINHELKSINKKITKKEVMPKDYQHLATTYEKLYEQALKKEAANKAHPHLLKYLKERANYHHGYADYLKNKDQMVKAQLNNVYDEGNVEYQLFLDSLEKFAEKHYEKFDYPFILY